MDGISVTNFADQTAVEGDGGSYRATIHPELSTPLGPYGAYVAGIALRAAGVHSKVDRPASISCHFLKPAKVGEAELEVETLRSAKRAESLRVSMTQAGEGVVEAIVWAVAEMTALEHQIEMPEVPGPDELRPFEELVKFRNQSDFDMVVEGRPLFDRIPDGEPPWGPEDMEPGPPVTRGWIRLREQPAFEDPFVETARRLIPIDWMVSGAGYRPHQGQPLWFPTMEVSASFHHLGSGSEWMFADCESPVGDAGVVWGRALIWSEEGRLLAAGSQLMLQRLMSDRSGGS